jgi:aryl-alcohol dehydrogenase-like predicted oxidoreductase
MIFDGSIPALGGKRIVLGGNVFGWTADRERSFAILDAFVAGGGAMIDTADVYSAWIPGNKGGESETIIGEWLKQSGSRHKVKIATKVGMWPGEGGEKLAPARIAAACDASLARLGVECIDLYYAHQDDDAVSQEAVAEAFATLHAAGKIDALGASNFTAERLQSALDLGTPYRVLQPEYSLVARGPLEAKITERRGGNWVPYEGAVQDLCVARGIAALPYFGLASGFLTGKYRDPEGVTGDRSYRVADYMSPEGLAVLAAMDSVAEEAGASHAEVALAWLNAQPGIAAPIASASGPEQVASLLRGADLTLSQTQLTRLTAAINL